MRFYLFLTAFFLSSPAWAGGVLRIGMTTADIPLTTGQPDQGMEGYRFAGYPIYDALVMWDLTRADRSPPLRPGLATSWEADPADRHRWVFTLREGVRFQDGTKFDAEAAAWNMAKIYADKSPQFDPRQSGQVRGRLSPIAGWRVIDPTHLEITTRDIDAFFPWEISYLFFSSPTQWEKLGRDWNAVALHPIGTGAFKVDRVVPRERMDLVPNPDHWDPTRRPKLDRLVLMPIPDAVTRSSALLSRQIDWAEAPAPDMLGALKAAGFDIVMNIYPHIWPYEPSRLPGSPWNDIRVRRAVNLAVDRDGLTKLLSGTMQPAVGYVDPKHPWFGTPSFNIRYDPAEAKRLLAEAGYGPGRKLVLRVGISNSGSGQMQPLPMNEFIQQNLADVGIELQFEVLEWETLRGRRRVGAAADVNRGITAINNSYGSMDPATAFLRQFDSSMIAPQGFNWGGFRDDRIDTLIRAAQSNFDPAAQDKLLAQAHTILVDEAVYLFVAHDLNPRAISKSVKGFVPAQSWFADLAPITMSP